ncbi:MULTISPECIES: glycosyltransferase family 4 protein [Campylobacter]|uniref:glycosyltransferase family 4 protein n=1 Tax=Campylobacter TaxID=194 RepID=UPI00027A35D3|nr:MULTISPECIES: glycosyltransferase family 4 protein [Campylobacter]EJP74659.1 glycosyltransferase, group 1 family protein [Campylobacter sp. FOBRC14]
MKKIVFLRLNPNAVGGAQRYLSRLIKALKNDGIECEVCAFTGSKRLSSWLKALKFNAQAKRQKAADELYFSLERITSADIYRAGDGVHKIYMKTKLFWWANPLNFVYPFLEKRCFANARKIIANSNFIKAQIVAAYGVLPEKIVTIYNGINLPQKVEKGSAKMALCEEFGLDYHLPIVLFVGSGFKRKGVSELLTLVSKLKTSVNLIIVGKDKKLNSYKNLAKKLGVSALFTGEQRSTAKFYEASDIFIFPTRYEPFSNVVLEALSYKNVVFTTAQNGASEILDEKFVMKDANDESVLTLIEQILNGHELLLKFQDEAARLAQNFTIEKNARLTLEVIEDALK